jgi:heptosyltransferase-2
MNKREKVLILKLGYSEFLDKEHDSRVVSLGDILRTTPLLHLYKKDQVTWITDESAFLLLEKNPYIERLLRYELTTVLQLESEEFDSVINLEKVPGICALADRIKAWKKYGFRFDTKTGKAEAYDKAFEVLAVSSNPASKKENQRTAQELLFEMVGAKWNQEEYILGYKPKTKEKYDVVLNTIVGQKWPNKAWPVDNWDKLEKMLINDGLTVSRQDKQPREILTNLDDYIDWINSSKIIVSNDSLGLHLGIALGKRVIGLFGPTPHQEVYFYGRGEAILPSPIPTCLPCFEGKCQKERFCLENILPERAYEKIKSFFN